MDTTRVFDTLDKKIEKLLSRLGTLETENEKLRADLTVARKAEKDAGDSRGQLEKLEKEQDMVRERLEKLIQTLESADGKKS
jgi:hypothetical protein